MLVYAVTPCKNKKKCKIKVSARQQSQYYLPIFIDIKCNRSALAGASSELSVRRSWLNSQSIKAIITGKDHDLLLIRIHRTIFMNGGAVLYDQLNIT